MRYRLTTILALAGVMILSISGSSVQMPKAGDWVRYRVMRASEWTPAAVEQVTLTVGAPARLADTDLVWWQMVVSKPEAGEFVVQALSERAPMTSENGDIGTVFRYIFKDQDAPALEYVNEQTGLAYLPLFGFRDGLIPTPRSVHNRIGPFLGTGNYLGQALAAQESGVGGEWLNLEPVGKAPLNDDVLIGTARMFKDDGTGQDETREYKYVELTAQDYDAMIDAGFNIFMVNAKHEQFVRDRGVFYVRSDFAGTEYPEMLYRSNFWGPAMFTDEPAIRLDPSDCRSVHDAANLLRLRNYAYHRAPGSVKLDFRLTQSDGMIRLIQNLGFNVGDWSPMQYHVPVWETINESAFYQMQGGAAGIVHEGRYNLQAFNGMLENVLGPGASVDVKGMYDLTYCFMRGAARAFNREWGTAIYGQADYSIAPEAVKRAYDMGAHYIWYWTSDHDHHLPFPRQLELSRIVRQYQKEHPRETRLPQLTSAKVAVAIPDGYICSGGPFMWGSPNFRFDKLNELGVPYGEINAQAFYHMYRLLTEGVDFDCVVDVPELINSAGYQHIIRIGADGRTNLPAPRMPALPPKVSVKPSGSVEQYKPREGAPKTSAFFAESGIRIDGKLDDWKQAKWIDLKEQMIYDVVNEKYNGEADLSASVAFAYDDEALYVAARVRDDIMRGIERGDLIWQNDSLQVAFDPLFNPHPEGTYALDDVEIGFAIVDGKPYAHQWNQRSSGTSGEVPGAEVVIIGDGDMTLYEARVPFSSLWPLTPGYPGRCGMSAVVNDSDTTLRKGALGWTHGLADGKNPSLFGVLEFEGAARRKNSAPMTFAQAEKTVIERGEDALFRLDTGAREATDLQATVVVRHNDLNTAPATASFKAPAGMNRFQLRLDTADLEPDSYRAEITLSADGKTVTRQDFRFYVLP